MQEENQDKSLYQENKNCVICSFKFDEKESTITKKSFCEFCSQETCEKCFKTRIPESQVCEKCRISLPYFEYILQGYSKNNFLLSDTGENDKLAKTQKEIDGTTKKTQTAEGQKFENNEKSGVFQELKEKNDKILRKKQKLNKKLKKLENFKTEFESKNCSDQLEFEKQINKQLKQELLLSKSFETLNIAELEKTLEDLKETIKIQSEFVEKLKNCVESPEIPQDYLEKQVETQKTKSKSLSEQLFMVNSKIS